MLGMNRKRGLFGGTGLVATPEQEAESARMEQMLGTQGMTAADGPMQQQAAPQHRGGLFGTGIKIDSDKLYALGGLLAGDGGAALQEIRQNKLKPLLEQAQREAEYADYVRKQEYEAAHPKPANNDSINDVNWYLHASEAERQAYHTMHPQYVTADNGDGTKTIVPIGPGMMGTGAPARPATQDDWDSAKPVGGGASNGVNTFLDAFRDYQR
jgi:hypothetical protein